MKTEAIKQELEKLIKNAHSIEIVTAYNADMLQFDDDQKDAVEAILKKFQNYKKAYSEFYTKSYRIVRAIAPERLEEFETFYTGNKKAKTLSYLDAGITHFLQDIVTRRYGEDDQNYFGKFRSGIEQQINILESILTSLDSSLFNIEAEIQFEVLQTEIEASKALHKSKQLRASGAVAGVVIEHHLKSVCDSKSSISFRKKNPTISDYNDALKANDVIDVVMWRLISRCADIRNLCVHSKDRDPTSDEVQDLIISAEKILAEIA